MEIRLGIFQDDVNAIPKGFSIYYKLEGELKDSEDISNPSIIVDVSSTANIKDVTGLYDKTTEFEQRFTNITYAYIEKFNRYYFVRKITVLRKNVIQYDLHVDVLNSFESFIKYQRVYVSRNENDYDIKLPDERRILKNTKQTIVYEPTTVSTGSLVNMTFNKNIGGANWNIVVSAINSNDSLSDYLTILNTARRYTSQFPAIGTIDYQSFMSRVPLNDYVIRGSHLHGVLSALKQDDDLSSFISHIYAYPFDLEDSDDIRLDSAGQNELEKTFIIGDTEIKAWNPSGGGSEYSIGNVYIAKPLSGEIIIAHFKLDSSFYAYDFNFLEPYSLYEIFLPFYGWREIRVASLLDHELLVFYIVNFTDGGATVYLYDKTSDNIIFSAPVQVGVEIPLSTTNAKEVKDRRTTNAISTVLQLVGSGLAITGGALTGNPLAVAGGVLAGTKAIGSSVANEKTNYDKGQIQMNNSSDTLMTPTKVYIRRTLTDVQYSADSNFLHRNGGICNKLKFLSACTGYTEVAEIPYYSYGGQTTDYRPTKTEEEEITTLLKKGVLFRTV